VRGDADSNCDDDLAQHGVLDLDLDHDHDHDVESAIDVLLYAAAAAGC